MHGIYGILCTEVVILQSIGEWGQFDFCLQEYCERNRVSKNRLMREAELQFAQLKCYYNNRIVRPDLTVLARICTVLNCNLSDILIYTPPSEK